MIENSQIDKRDPSFFRPSFGPLLTPSDVLERNPGSGVDVYDRQALRGLTAMARYVTAFLTSGHPELGRAGAVCPYAARALEQNLIRLTAFDLAEPDEAAICAGMARLRGVLGQLVAGADDETARDRAIVAVFPGLSVRTGSAMVERVQKTLKPTFIDRELMIGQFYPSCPEPGLWNPGFRPLQAPVVSLAIRNITLFDAPFMLERQGYVDAFVRLFGQAGEARIAKARRDRQRAGDCPRHASRRVEPPAGAQGEELSA